MPETRPSGLRRWLAGFLGATDDGPRVAGLAGEVRRVTARLGGAAPPAADDDEPVESLELAVGALWQATDGIDRASSRVEWHAAELTGGGQPPGGQGLEQRLLAVEELLEGARPAPEPEPVAKAVAAPEPVAEAVATAAPAGDDDEPAPSATATELMRLLDRVAMAVAADGPNADPLLAWLRDRMVAVLDGEGVALIDEQGPFDVARHEVVETRTTLEPELAHTISGTVRPGYEHAGVVLRPQQVVLWKFGGPGRRE